VLYAQVTPAAQFNSGNGLVGFAVFRRNGVSAGPNTITVTSNVANDLLDLAVLEYAHAGGAVNEVAVRASSNGTVPPSVSATVLGRNQLIIAAMINQVFAGDPTGTAFTTRVNFWKTNVSDQLVTTPGPVSITYPARGVGWLGKLIAFGPP
jgi:hypothetical protein